MHSRDCAFPPCCGMEAIGRPLWIRIVFRIVVVLFFFSLARDPLLKRDDGEALPLCVECCCAANIISLSVFIINSSCSYSSGSSDGIELLFPFFLCGSHASSRESKFFLARAWTWHEMEHPPCVLLFAREKRRNRKLQRVCVGANAFGTRQKVVY